MDLSQLISDVARAKNDLAELQRDESVAPDRFKRCVSTVTDLENYVSQILGTAWVPNDRAELTRSISRACQNNRCMRKHVEAAIDAVVINGEPDELFRVRIVLMFCRIADHQLQLMMAALGEIMANAPQGQYVN